MLLTLPRIGVKCNLLITVPQNEKHISLYLKKMQACYFKSYFTALKGLVSKCCEGKHRRYQVTCH